jgi:hypothetical protein
MCGKTYRERNVQTVLEELETTKRRLIFFVDDNLVNNRIVLNNYPADWQRMLRNSK